MRFTGSGRITRYAFPRPPGTCRSDTNGSYCRSRCREASVRTPQLVVFDETCDIISVPYTLFEWVPGASLEGLGVDPAAAHAAWHELGGDFARLHSVERGGPADALRDADVIPDPRALAETRATEGWITASELRWLQAWIGRLAVVALPVAQRLLHLDTQGTNVIVHPESFRYAALLDWGCAAWGDPARDFCMPLSAVPYVLAGHREVAPFDDDDSMAARILWYRIRMILYILPRGAMPGFAWAEHPLAQLFDLMRFLLQTEDPEWRDLRP